MRPADDDAKGKTKLDKIAARVVTEACDGDVQAAREIGDRLDGKVPQAVVGDANADPIRVINEVRRVIVEPGS